MTLEEDELLHCEECEKHTWHQVEITAGYRESIGWRIEPDQTSYTCKECGYDSYTEE